ncbi:thiamine pyrophosphate-binding protein [Prauserella sp. PE36]|uniref:thiamine pyrophosphate-dependent enzyme n=1 Tax=Prauserella sp. PE36 TaxID=1504709 RepID=UPI000DE1BDEC|nr:thiamine pyrophosphate-dependent enzyme [Prauserella sp. PE36]RBM11622.1 thiamine pyrophosphate-binding protein [Prauserella sp. PE36]
MSQQTGPAQEGPTRTGGRLLVESLLAHNPPLWTCVPGESFLPILDALIDPSNDGTAKLVTTRHESAAGNMAEAAGKLTGRPAVCLVTRGPGATHASIAVHTAHQDGTPLILIVGQVPRAHLRREAFQEMDYRAVFGSFAKDVVEIMEADRIPEHVAHAVHTSMSGRPGPVVLVVPEDVLDAPTPARPTRAAVATSPPICASDWNTLRTELAAARRPCLVVGGPGWSTPAAAQVAAFAERNQVPVVTPFRWQDAIDNTSPSFAGYLGLGCSPRLRQLLTSADLVVALGPRLDDPTTGGYAFPSPESRLVTVSRSRDELGRFPLPDVAIHADPASACERLEGAVLDDLPERVAWYNELRAQQVEFSTPPRGAETSRQGVDLTLVVRHVRDSVPDDSVITNGAGNYTVWVQRFFGYRDFGTQLAPRNGAMGYALPAGLAAAQLHPERVVVTFAGDGCFLMSGSELATAVRHGLRLIVIVVNNSMFGTIRMHQERRFPGRAIATDLTNPDFVAYAESFGALGVRVTDTVDFPDVFKRALDYNGPALIEIVTDPEQITPDQRITTVG